MNYKKFLLAAVLMFSVVLSVQAQRTMDKLDRGLVAVKTSSGVFCTWRILGEEYYDVVYNLYRDGVKIAEGLNVSNYTDAAGSVGSKYTVKSVVRGKEQEASMIASVWSQNFLEITPKHDNSITSTLVPNDACCADVDGDGELEILMKFDNQNEISANFPKNGNNGEYTIMEVLKLDGTVLWWINCGPNMGDFQNNEQNIMAYDWDLDGKAEAVMRLAEGSTIHLADGTTYTIGADGKNGTAWTNYRTPKTGGVEWFTHYGNEFLVYCEGSTGKPYVVKEFPLKRLEPGETDLNTAWGDGYGHRSSKFFFGAPCLDGRKPSIFLARGIYTRHKMVALDVNPVTHELTERWRWNNNTPGSPWYGQGYHNFGVADVDWDGRDEIVFGSMVIDDNGKGLSTTGLGHGDAQHCGDFNPYVHGQEIFACNEDNPANNYRDATTSKIYYRKAGGGDDGRSNCGNFSNKYPGCLGSSGHDLPVSTVYNEHVGVGSNISVNFRIYWNGDLCEELFDGNISSFDTGRSWNLPGGLTNNGTKATPCYQGDILGDWREEVIMRTSDNKFRIYTTTEDTPWRNYTLWHDTQYRNAMVWQMCGYNQPPHTSYFLGELEGITQAPPALTMTGRIEVKNGGTINNADTQNPHWLLAETSDATVSVQDGCSPYIVTVNTPSWVQGHDNNDNIMTEYFTHKLTGGAFAGAMRLVKQGDGILELPNVVEKYTGNTDVWAGTLRFNGKLESSPLWLNRHTTLESDGGVFKAGIKADYNATLSPGTASKAGVITATDLKLGFGSRVVFDVFSDGQKADCIKATSMSLEKKNWQYGPQYSAPVFQFVTHTASGSSKLAEGNYLIGEIGSIEGSLDNLVTEGLDGLDAKLIYSDGKLYLSVGSLREATTLTWNGNEGSVWDLNNTKNFKNTSNAASEFVSGDAIVFDDNASTTNVEIAADIYPSSVVFKNNSKDYTLSGSAIGGNATLSFDGTGNVTINNTNKYIGSTTLNGGKVTVSSLANGNGVEYGAFGSVSNVITMNGGMLAVSKTITGSNPISLRANGGTIEVPSGVMLTLDSSVKKWGTDGILTKTGAGKLVMGTGNNFSKLYVNSGTVDFRESGVNHSVPDLIVFNGSNVTVNDPYDTYSYSNSNANWEVPEGCTGTVNLDGRCNYKGRLTGKGTLHVYAPWVRNYLQGDWSRFEGTLVSHTVKKDKNSDPVFSWENNYGLPKATLNISSGTTFTGGSRNLTLGNLAGSGVLSLTGYLTVGGINKDVSFSGTFDGKVTVFKDGDGAWTFSKVLAANEYTFRGGEIRLNNTKVTTSLFGSAVASVQDKAMMVGQGTVGNIRFNSGGVLQPGDYTSSRRYGSIKTTGFLYMYEGSKLNLVIYSNTGNQYSRSWLVVGGNFDFNGELNIELGEGFVPQIGDEFVMWTAGSFSGTPSAIHLPALPSGLYWDTSDLLTKSGTLRVIDEATAIRSVTFGGKNDGKIYDLNGNQVQTPLKKGIYIKNGRKVVIK